MYLETSALGLDDGTPAPILSDHVEFADPVEASLVAQFAAFRHAMAIHEEQQKLFYEAYGLLAGFVSGVTAGFFRSYEDRLKNAAIGGAIGGIASIAVLVFINIIRNANEVR